jgi:hypothetical protein
VARAIKIGFLKTRNVVLVLRLLRSQRNRDIGVCYMIGVSKPL